MKRKISKGSAELYMRQLSEFRKYFESEFSHEERNSEPLVTVTKYIDQLAYALNGGPIGEIQLSSYEAKCDSVNQMVASRFRNHSKSRVGDRSVGSNYKKLLNHLAGGKQPQYKNPAGRYDWMSKEQLESRHALMLAMLRYELPDSVRVVLTSFSAGIAEAMANSSSRPEPSEHAKDAARATAAFVERILQRMGGFTVAERRQTLDALANAKVDCGITDYRRNRLDDERRMAKLSAERVGTEPCPELASVNSAPLPLPANPSEEQVTEACAKKEDFQ